jgi:serine/threonine protein kinase
MKKNHDSRIVGCFDAWLENETTSGVHSGLFFKDILLCIQMEYCEKTLQNIMEEMKTDKIFNGSQCLTEVGYYIASDIFIQIVEGVKFLHEKNIIHRDLKPNNILLNSNFNERYVKIADFGLVAFHEFAQESHTSKVGNELYAAPEVRFGRNYNMKSDIFSLGVILNELFKIDKYEVKSFELNF